MKTKELNLFDALSKNGYEKKDVVAKLRVKNGAMTVDDYMNRFMNGGLRHKYFQAIYDICLGMCNREDEKASSVA